MLVIGRFRGESLVVNENVEIEILKISRGGLVRLGITAPRDIPVHRKEVQEKIDREKANK